MKAISTTQKSLVMSTLLTISICLNSFAQILSCKPVDGAKIFSIDFGEGVEQIGSNTPAYYGFYTTYKQKFNDDLVNDGMFAFENVLRNEFGVWQGGLKDHTSGDGKGHMMVINADYTPGEFYRDTVIGLCLESTYRFSAYFKNIYMSDISNQRAAKPNVRFEVRAVTDGSLISIANSGSLEAGASIAWGNYGISFQATSTDVVLLLVSDAPGGMGNDLAIDDITLAVENAPTAIGNATVVESGLNVYPNPASEKITVDLGGRSTIGNIRVTNSIGIEVYSSTINGNSASLSLQNFPKGLYNIEVNASGKWMRKKMVVN